MLLCLGQAPGLSEPQTIHWSWKFRPVHNAGKLSPLCSKWGGSIFACSWLIVLLSHYWSIVLGQHPCPGNALSIWSDLYKRPLSNCSLSNARSKLFVRHCPLFFRTRKRMHSCPKTCFPLICAIRLNVCSSFSESAHSKKSIPNKK